MNVLLIPPLLGLVGMVAALIVYRLVMKYPDGQDKVKKIGDQIHNGALAFMKTEYKYLLAFMSVLVVLVYFAPGLGIHTAIAVITGAAASSLAGFIGMYAATKANVRTATAAQQDGAAAALSVSFYGGSVMGLCVASLGLIGLGGLYYFFSDGHVHALEALEWALLLLHYFQELAAVFLQKC
jgi:Inorganic pyrophosphatase